MTMMFNNCRAIWFMNVPGGDVLACVQKSNAHCSEHKSFDYECQACCALQAVIEAMTTPPPEKFEVIYRFRWYDPDDPRNEAFSGKDRKSWYVMPNLSLDKAFEVSEVLLEGFRKIGVKTIYELIRGEDETDDSFMNRFQEAPFVHMKIEKRH